MLAPTRVCWAERFAARARLAGVPSVFIPFDSVKVEATIRQIAHGTFGPGPLEVGQVDIADRQRFHVFGRLGSYAITGERKIARCQNAALRILDIHIANIGQISDIAGQHDETLIFDSPSL